MELKFSHDAPVQSFSANQYPANAPIEDRLDARIVERGTLACVCDGHGGWNVSQFAKKTLLATVQSELGAITEDCDDDAVLGAMRRAYERVDRDWQRSVEGAFSMGFGEVAKVGSCALTVLATLSKIFVANAGDCRAVVGRLIDGQWSGEALTNDHNARLASEKARLAEEHPGEKDIVVCRPHNPDACYVKGRLQPTRALGDLYLKYSEFNGNRDTDTMPSYGRRIPPPYTPPYITATPEVSALSWEEGREQFIVMASDGLWDVLSNQEAVEVVAAAAAKDPDAAANQLTMEALKREASAAGLSAMELMQLPPGKSRRRLHDDITVVVIYLKGGSVVGTSSSSSSGSGWLSGWFGGSGEDSKSK
jgi:pyruvate dehydrogenase phosphatase